MTPDIPAPRRQLPRPGTGAALGLLAAVVVTAAACLLLVSTAPPPQHVAVAWSSSAAAVLLCTAVTTATYYWLATQRLRGAVAAKEHEIAAREAADERFASVTVPFVVERLRKGASAETALAAAPPTEHGAQRTVLTTLALEVHRGESQRASALSACANAAGRVQALATGLAADLREMEHRHADEEVLGDLLHLDHRVAQAGRLADSIAVLTGARSGRRWAKPIVMESLLRGALGRISGYQRVRLHSTSTVAIAGHAAEGVMHVLAELMDNAANFSPPTCDVHVYVEEMPHGVVVTVEDGGLAMGEVALHRAEHAVSGESFDLAELSGSRLGLAVVGRLARKHGLSVSFRPSAHGGTGVVVLLPQDLITEPRRGDRRPAHETLAAAVREAPAQQPAPVTGSAPHPVREQPVREQPVPERPVREPAHEHDFRSRTAQEPESRSSASECKPVGGPHSIEETRAAASAAPSALPAADTPPVPENGTGGLPKRRRGQALASAQQQRDRAAQRSASTPRTPRSGSSFGAFRKAVLGIQEAQDAQDAQRPIGRAPGDSAQAAPHTGPADSSLDSGHTEPDPPDAPHLRSPATAAPRPEDHTE